MTADRVSRISNALEMAFAPGDLLVKDQSHLHAGHAGAEDGKGHFDVRIVSDAFEGKNRIERHRMIYAALDEMMKTEIHALKIQAQTPAEHSPG